MYIAVLVFTTVIGLRYGVGDDFMSYKGFFSNPKLFPKMEYGFTYVNKFFYAMDFHYSTIFVLVAFLEVYFFVRAFDNFKQMLPWGFFFLFTTLQLFIWDNVLRQSTAFCIILFSIKLAFERKLIPFALCILVAGSIHKSAYPMAVFYFLLNFKVKDDRWLQYMIFFGTFAVGSLIKTFLFAHLGTIAGAFGMGGNVSDAEFLKTVDWSNKKNSLGVASLMWMMIDVFSIWLYPTIKNKYKEVGFEMYYKLYFIGIVLQNSIGGSYFDRLNMYFLPFRMIIYSFVMYEMSKKKDVIYRVPIMMFCGLTFALFLWAIHNKAGTCAPYAFVFD